MKRKLYLWTVAAVMLGVMASCNSKKTSNNWADEEDYEDTELVDDEDADEDVCDDIDVAPDELWTEDAVADMLRRAYADVSTVFTPQEDGLEPNIDLDGMYCTEHWNEVLRKVRVANYRQTDPDNCFNELSHWNPWMEGKVRPTNIKVDLLTGNIAEASFQLKHGEEWIQMKVSVFFENGKWLINNWEQQGDSEGSLLAEMEKYAEQYGAETD